MLTPDEEITGSEELVSLSDVRARVKYIEEHDCGTETPDETPCENAAECPSCADWADEELAALEELEAEMAPLGEHASAIGERYMDEFVRNELEGIYGEAVDALSSYLDWRAIRADREGDMTETKYRGGTYYLVP